MGAVAYLQVIEENDEELRHLQGPEKRAEYGILDNLVRYSCGVEDVEDIWADIEQALAKL